MTQHASPIPGVAQVPNLAAAAPWRRKKSASTDQSADHGTEGKSTDPMVLSFGDCESLQLPPGLVLPPGLELSTESIQGLLGCISARKDFHLSLEAGLPAKLLADASDGAESDDTSAGSIEDCDSSQSGTATHDLAEGSPLRTVDSDSPRFILVDAPERDAQNEAPQNHLFLSELVLSDVSELRASSPNFVPALTPGLVAHGVPLLPPAARTKLSSKANFFVPGADTAALGALPFMPMAAVTKAWESWDHHLHQSGWA